MEERNEVRGILLLETEVFHHVGAAERTMGVDARDERRDAEAADLEHVADCREDRPLGSLRQDEDPCYSTARDGIG